MQEEDNDAFLKRELMKQEEGYHRHSKHELERPMEESNRQLQKVLEKHIKQKDESDKRLELE